MWFSLNFSSKTSFSIVKMLQKFEGYQPSKAVIYSYRWHDGLVVSALDQQPRGRGFESAGCGLSCSNRGPVALCTLGLGLFNPPSSRGR